MKYLFVVVSLLVCCWLQAQKFDLGKVSVKELEEKSCPTDPDAAAAILYNRGKTKFRYSENKGFVAVHEYEFRIKIYKPEGLKWANFEVPFYVGYQNLVDDRIQFDNAVTYNLENGAIVKTKLSGEGKFRKDINEFWNVASIAMPNVRAGSVIEFKYTHTSDDLGEFPVYRIQYDIPVRYSEYRTEIPEFFIYKPVILGFGNVKSEAKIVSGHQTYDNKFNQMTNLSYQQINSSYTVSDVPALVQEPFVDNLDNYRLSVHHELDRTRFPDAPEKKYSTDWEGVARTIFKDKQFGGELEQRNYFEQDLPAVTRSSNTDYEKANAILEHVKRSVKWNGKYGYYVRKGVKQAYTDKSGNVAEVNFILISMLNHAGINANPVLVSTIENGVPAFPNLRVFNYVIAAAEIDGKQVLLDATDPISAPDILPTRALNWMGRLVRRDASSAEINLVPSAVSKEMVTVMAAIGPDGKGNGKIRRQRTDYAAADFRSKHGGQDRGQYLEKLEDQLGEIKITDYTLENDKDLSQPVTETFTFAADGLAEVIGEKMYINPMLFFTTAQSPLVQSQRKLPLYFGYPKQTRYHFNLEIPAGFAVESLPQSGAVSTGENVGMFNFNIQQSGNKIQLTVTQEINAALISAGFYDPMKEFYAKSVEKQNEKIVLKKI